MRKENTIQQVTDNIKKTKLKFTGVREKLEDNTDGILICLQKSQQKIPKHKKRVQHTIKQGYQNTKKDDLKSSSKKVTPSLSCQMSNNNKKKPRIFKAVREK